MDLKEFNFPNSFELAPSLRGGAKEKPTIPVAALAPGIAPLHSTRKPAVVIKEESSVHRSMCLLRCEGFSVREIADKLEYSASHVQDVLRQPWAEKFILEMIHAQSQEGLDRVYKKYEAEALDIAHLLMSDETQSPKLRRDTAIDILKITRGNRVVVEDTRRSLEDLKREEEILQKKIDSLTPQATPNVTGSC